VIPFQAVLPVFSVRSCSLGHLLKHPGTETVWSLIVPGFDAAASFWNAGELLRIDQKSRALLSVCRPVRVF
jgi:hypothetical protein